jgi:hypothetical protein
MSFQTQEFIIHRFELNFDEYTWICVPPKITSNSRDVCSGCGTKITYRDVEKFQTNQLNVIAFLKAAKTAS